MGEIEHSEMIAAVLKWFFRHEIDWSNRWFADAAWPSHLFSRKRHSGVLRSAPTAGRHLPLVVEVLSPEDRIDRYHQRINDYRQMGIPGIWVLDPETHRGWDCSSGNWIEGTLFRLPDSPVYLDLNAVYGQ